MQKTSSKRLMAEDYEIRRENVYKIYFKYKEMKDGLQLNPGETEPQAREAEVSSDGTSSDEVDVLGFTDDEKLDNDSSITKEMKDGLQVNPEETKPQTREAEVNSGGTSSDEVVDVPGFTDDEKSDNDSNITKELKKSTQAKPKKTDSERSEADGADDTSSDEICSLDVRDDEKLDDGNSIYPESCNEEKLEKSSSNNSLTIHVCPYENCDKFFSRPSRLSQHIYTHTGERPFVCSYEKCSKSYTRQQHLKRHIEVCHGERETTKKVKCAVCNQMLGNTYSLRKHVLRHHVLKKHECRECGKSFHKHKELQKHTFVHTGINPFPCDYPGCETRCTTLSKLKGHKLKHQKCRYACPQASCQQKFDTYKDLQHHCVAEHPKVCDVCGRQFRRLGSLRMHRLTHENMVKAYYCTYPACDKYYTRLNNLTAHIKDKHEQVKIYECGSCARRLSTKQKLIHHMTTHSPTYKRNYASEKPRKTRKDIGLSRQDYARLLSGYYGNEEEEDVSHVLQSEIVAEKNADTHASPNLSLSPHSEHEVLNTTEDRSSNLVPQTEET